MNCRSRAPVDLRVVRQARVTGQEVLIPRRLVVKDDRCRDALAAAEMRLHAPSFVRVKIAERVAGIVDVLNVTGMNVVHRRS